MMFINTKDLVFKPMYPFKTMIIIGIILAVIVLLNRRHIINRLLIIALLIIISQRPMLKNQNEATYNLNLDVLFVVDNTVSMNAVDVNGETRLNALKKDCNKIIDLMKGANFALITYSNLSIVKYPFTSDIAVIKDVINSMKIIDPVYANGSTLDMPHDNMKLLLESSNKKEKHHRIVFFMGDGELVGKEKVDNDFNKYNDIKELVNGGLIMGYGTSAGGKVVITESVALDKLVNSDGFLIDASSMGSLSISKINEDNLKKVANVLKLEYSHMPNDDILQSKIESIKEEAIVNDEGEEELDKDIYYYFSGVLIVLLLFELFHYRRDER